MNRSRTYLTPNRHEKYMVVDGYNIINAWESLKKFINDDLDFARGKINSSFNGIWTIWKNMILL